MAYIDLYEWNEVLAAGAPVSTMVMKPQHCYYVEASVYDHRSDDSGAVPAVKDLRYVKNKNNIKKINLLTQNVLENTLTGGSEHPTSVLSGR